LKARIKKAVSTKIEVIGLPMLALCWVSFFWGTTWIASKEGVKHMPPMQLVAIRQFLGGILYVAYFVFKKEPWPKNKQWKTILILSAIFPIWMVIISFFRGEQLSKLAVTGLLICFGGVCIIFYDHLKDFLQPDFSFGIFLSLVATLTWAFGTLYTKKKAASFNPYFSVGLQMMISSLFLFALIGATGTTIPLSEIPANSWWSIGYLVIIGSVLTFIAFIYALQKLPAEVNSVYAYINPIVAVILGAIIFGEPLTLFIAIGGIIVLVGLYLVNKEVRKKKLTEIKNPI
jgi:drug/metabolite transporter (DMT)-like permease